jgi:hypothetical protein
MVETELRKLLQMEFSGDGACRIRTRGLRLANPSDSPTPPDTNQQERHGRAEIAGSLERHPTPFDEVALAPRSHGWCLNGQLS